MYDIVFLSYNEINADLNWSALTSRFPWAKRLHGVKGILPAHQQAASICHTRYFWVVDADNLIEATFDFVFKWPRTDQAERVAVWRAQNQVNGLIYGYGGLKLLPRQRVIDMEGPVVDFTTSISPNFHVMEEVASTTMINSSAFDAWKAGFRECVKLASGLIDRSRIVENTQRLRIWTSVGAEQPFGTEAIRGAQEGLQYGTENTGNSTALAKINNFDWLRERFDG